MFGSHRKLGRSHAKCIRSHRRSFERHCKMWQKISWPTQCRRSLRRKLKDSTTGVIANCSGGRRAIVVQCTVWIRIVKKSKNWFKTILNPLEPFGFWYQRFDIEQDWTNFDFDIKYYPTFSSILNVWYWIRMGSIYIYSITNTIEHFRCRMFDTLKSNGFILNIEIY